MIKRVGSYTVEFIDPPIITGYSSVVGKKEAEGPLGKYFDKIFYDSRAGQPTWEKAEAKFQQEAFIGAMAQFLKLGFGVSSAQMNAGLEALLNSGLWF